MAQNETAMREALIENAAKALFFDECVHGKVRTKYKNADEAWDILLQWPKWMKGPEQYRRMAEAALSTLPTMTEGEIFELMDVAYDKVAEHYCESDSMRNAIRALIARLPHIETKGSK